MNNEQKHKGFSLTEVLLAIGTLAIGMIFVGGVFPVAIHFTTIATERTIAAVAADEAFAKIRLYGVDLANPALDVNQVPFEAVTSIDPDEFFYPSTNVHSSEKQYCWSALCRRVGLSDDVQVTVFVSRKIGGGTVYWGGTGDRPIAVRVGISEIIGKADELQIIGNKTFINDGYTIVDNETGDIYRVLERYAANDNVILLDRDWQGVPVGGSVWVVPPPAGGRYPCVAVYQKVIKF